MTVLWRLRSPAGDASHASLLPGGPPFTLAFVVAGRTDRVENYDTLDLAVFRATDVRRSLLADGWRDEAAADEPSS